MATVRILESDLGTSLPRVCITCGAPAVATVRKEFSWQPSWVIILIFFGLLPYILVAFLLTRRMALLTPLCKRHRSYWSARAWLAYGGGSALAVLGFLALLFLGSQQGPGGRASLGGLLCAAVGFFGLAWLVAVAVIQHVSIRPTEITERDLSLTNVAIEFADAVLDRRSGDGAWDEGPRDADGGTDEHYR